jgi:hypothetical protein
MSVDYEDVVLKCTVCDGEFNPGTEGGRSGYIGILPVNFCPTCTSGIFDFAEQQYIHSEERLRDYIVDYFNDHEKVCIKANEDYIINYIHDLMERAEPCDT